MPRSGGKIRRDSKHRILRPGESVRSDGKYQFKYQMNGKAHFFYSWRLEANDPLPAGKMPCLSLRELEKQHRRDIETLSGPEGLTMSVLDLVERYIKTKTGVKYSTQEGYQTVVNTLKQLDFSARKIATVKRSDAKLFLIGLQDSGKSYSSIHTIRGVLRPAFQMAVDDEVIRLNPFDFQMASVLIDDRGRREAISKKEMEKFLKFVHDDNCYYKYYEAFYILFHTGLRISEFCGLTVKDLDMEKQILNVDHQLQRRGDSRYIIETTKTNAGTRRIPMTGDVYACFQSILESRKPPKPEPMIEGYTGFLYYDKNGKPLVALHWEHYFRNAVNRYNEIYRVQMPAITPHVCRHTYCSNMARAGMNPKTLQYLMGHSDISVTMNTYTHLGLEDAENELRRLSEINSARAELDRLNGKDFSIESNVKFG